MRSLQQSRAQDWARRTLTTIGEACRAVKAETLERMIDWVVDKLTGDLWSIADIKAVLVYSGCRVREAGLLPPPALRTGRESFPSSGSSISKAV
jgi:hypothetical protein